MGTRESPFAVRLSSIKHGAVVCALGAVRNTLLELAGEVAFAAAEDVEAREAASALLLPHARKRARAVAARCAGFNEPAAKEEEVEFDLMGLSVAQAWSSGSRCFRQYERPQVAQPTPTDVCV